jgi:hypothetical protein
VKESNDHDEESCRDVGCVREDRVEVTDEEEERDESADEYEEETCGRRGDEGEPLKGED